MHIQGLQMSEAVPPAGAEEIGSGGGQRSAGARLALQPTSKPFVRSTSRRFLQIGERGPHRLVAQEYSEQSGQKIKPMQKQSADACEEGGR